MQTWYGSSFRLGVLGGGQLGRMLIQEAINLNVKIHCLDPDPQAPCSEIASSFTVGSLNHFDTVYAFGKDKDLITVEIENVNIEALEKLEAEGKKVFPQPRVLKLIKDKGLQKNFYKENNIPTADFRLIDSQSELNSNADFLPFVQKMRTGGYDGKGVKAVRSEADFEAGFSVPSVLEKFVPFQKELATMVARTEDGKTCVFPTVECEFNPEANLVEFLFAPANISPEIEQKAAAIATDIITKLDMVGVLAVEFFLTQDNELLVNEIAPRPHNSGHQTIECNRTSQYEQHLRSILNLPLGDTSLLLPGVMINLLGEEGFEGKAVYEGLEEALAIPGVKPHIYGKELTKAFRKMGHVTIVNPSLEEAKKTGRKVQQIIKVKTA
ncbi:MAG: 5-(carboxyamino)imidazole ribonucleotide synthase [Crocinitomicaceae bacterium]|jgi:5-(carboxyamino)imidazole ribonucleotide synthase|nr:5-(carboxyamino)imidazole ribonucleotide synthase [Crocinitomicaceae bacterium]